MKTQFSITAVVLFVRLILRLVLAFFQLSNVLDHFLNFRLLLVNLTGFFSKQVFFNDISLSYCVVYYPLNILIYKSFSLLHVLPGYPYIPFPPPPRLTNRRSLQFIISSSQLWGISMRLPSHFPTFDTSPLLCRFLAFLLVIFFPLYFFSIFFF